MTNDSAAQTYSFSILAGQYWTLGLPIRDVGGFWIFQVTIDQKSRELEDVCVEVMDEDNFKTWEIVLQAIAAGADAAKLPVHEVFISGKLAWGTLSFSPPSPSRYHIILDNTKLPTTTRDGHILLYWVPSESNTRMFVRQATDRFEWSEVWRLFNQFEADLDNGKLSNSCDNMRKALVLLWVKVCETLSRKPVPLDSGKSPDIGALKEKLSHYAPEYTIGLLSQTWSLVSELAHIEKRGGKEPPLNEVLFAFHLVYSSAAFLVSLVPASS